MTAETRHFSREEMNLLVMDIARVPDGMRRWSDLIQRRFQPTRNTRFGAVALIERRHINGSIENTVSVLRNAFALKPLPEKLLEDLESL